MNLKEILNNLSIKQLEDLVEVLEYNPESIVDYLTEELNKKKEQSIKKDESKKEDVSLGEKNLTQMDNISNYFSSFDKFKNELQLIFNDATSNNYSKDLITKLHDRLIAIVIEYITIKSYIPGLDNLVRQLEEGSEEEILLNFLQDRKKNLEDQYRLLSYLYGEQLGLKDEEIINKGYILENYSAVDLYAEIANNGITLQEALDSVYLKNNNSPWLLCTRDSKNMLNFSNFNAPRQKKQRSQKEFVYYESTLEKYYPFNDERIEQLYEEVIAPYYKKMDMSFTRDSKVDTITVIDDYLGSTLHSNFIDFYNEGEYHLTVDIVNEFLKQKQKHNGNQL